MLKPFLRGGLLGACIASESCAVAPGAPMASAEGDNRVYDAQIAMLSNSPQVQGTKPCILKDFRAMLRSLPGIQDYRNRKGLIDQNGRRKLAFDVLRYFYRSEWANAEGE